MSTSVSVDVDSGGQALTVGLTTILNGTNGNVLLQLAGVLGESPLTTLLDNLGGLTGTY